MPRPVHHLDRQRPRAPQLYGLGSRFGWGRRLRGAAAFEAVFADRRHSPIRTPVFTIYRRDNDRGYPRLGMAVSRRAVRKAVQRNRVKRCVRETFRQQPGLPGMDFVVTCVERADQKANPREMATLLRETWRTLACPQDHRG